MNTVASLPEKLLALSDEVAALPAMSLTGSSVILPVPRAAEMVTTMREAASALRSSGEAFGWYCARDKRFYRAGEWGNAACEHCTSLYTTPPSAPAAEQGDSRSRVRRIAIEKGEPAPRFDEQPEGKGAYTLPPDTGPFADWLEHQMPPGTVISNPRWWAPRIFRAVCDSLGRSGEGHNTDWCAGWNAHLVATAYPAPAAPVGVDEIRRAVADYMWSDDEKHERKLAELLGVPRFDDDSGFDFSRFRTAALAGKEGA